MNDQIIEQQRKNWNQFAPGWDKWEELLMNGMQVFSDQLITELCLEGDEHILDVASGTGEPGLTICTHLPQGKVTAVDLSINMVAIANDNAKQRGIVNFQNQLADASDLPFDDNSFNHIISRFGIMFFPDMEKEIREMTKE